MDFGNHYVLEVSKRYMIFELYIRLLQPDELKEGILELPRTFI